MNKIYRCIWNDALGAWVAVSELTCNRGKRSQSSKREATKRLTIVSVEPASVSETGVANVRCRTSRSHTKDEGGFKSPGRPTRRRAKLLLVSFLAQAIALALVSTAAAQVVIPAGTDIGTYLNTGTNWSATRNQFAINANATWNNVINPSTAAHSTLSINGNGHVVTRAGNYVVHYDNTSVSGNSITFSNLTFGQTASSSLAIFDNDATTARTLNIYLNNATFNGLTGAGYGGSVFLMYPNTAPNNNVVMNVTAGTGANGVVMSNNSGTGDSGGVVGMYSGLLNFYGNYTFNSNSTGNYGGAIAMYQTNGVMTFNGAAAFNNNFATNYFGGSVDIWGGSSTLTFNGPTTFTGNRVVSPQTGAGNPRGGAINIGYTAPTIAGQPALVQFNNNVTFDGNYVVSTGAGGYAYGGAISAYGNGASYNYQYIFNSAAIFQNNYVVKAGTGAGTGNGGAIYYDASGALVSLTSGTQFLNNYASTNGGAIYLQSGTISLSALTNNILFEGNRRGVSFGTSGSYAPVPGTGTPNAIFLGSSGNLNLNANAGRQIQFYDPISSAAGSTVTVTKSGNGEAIFYGDNGASTNYDSTIQANTTVNGGYFTLVDGVAYGISTSGAFIVTTGTGTQGTVQGGNNSSLRALTLTVQNGGTVGVTGGTFNLNAPTINVQSGGQFGGNGTLAATSNINIAGTTFANINAGNTLNITGLLAGSGGITAQGGGVLGLSNPGNSYTGATTVVAGSTLMGGVANAFASSGSVAVNGTLDLSQNNLNQTAHSLSGTGSILLGSATLTANNGATNTTFSGGISGPGSLTKTGTGALTLSGTSSTYSGGTTISAGTLVATHGGALGTGLVTDSATLQLDFAANSTLANQLAGSGTLSKTSAGVATLTATNSSAGIVNVSAGTLDFEQSGGFAVTNYLTTGSGATTTLGAYAHLTVTNAFTEAAGSTLNVNVGTSNAPLISSASASLNGTLNVASFAGTAPASASALAGTQHTIIHTTGGITGDFSSVTLGSASSPVDYLTLAAAKTANNLDYNVGFGLTWLAGPTLGNGVFTLANATNTFNVDVTLSNQAASATGWNGNTLTKNGAGTLTLSALNTYTGPTIINDGTLATGIANTFATSSAVTVNSGATLALNGFSQLANNLSGVGAITLGSATLTANNSATSTTFAGGINGGGALDKTGAATLTLSGVGSSIGAVDVQAGTLSLAQTGLFTATGYTTETGATTSMGGAAQLAVTGAFTQDAGAALDVAIGSNQPIITAGTAALNGALSVTGFSASAPTSASALTSTQFTVLHTTGGITGDFTSVTLGSATSPVDYLTLAAAKTANNLDYNVGFGLTWLAGPILGNGVFTLTAPTSAFNVDIPLANEAASATGWNGTTLTKNGAGTLTLSAHNTYTGPTIINDGTLATGIANAFATSSAVTLVNSGATLALNGFSQLANNLSGVGAISLGSATLTANNSTTNTTFAGTISGTGALDKTGAATLTLSGANTYSGGTTLSTGTLTLGNAGALGSGTLAMAAGTTLDFLGSYTVNNAVTLSGDPTFNVNTGLTTTWTGSISNGTVAGVLNKTGPGTLVLTAANTYSGGSTLSAGTLVAKNGSALGTGAISNSAALQLDFASNGTLANSLSGTGSLTNTGNVVTTLSASGSSEGAVAVNAGTLQFGQTGAFNAASYITQSGATTAIDGAAQLAVTGAFTQAAGSTLDVTLGSNNPVITAGTAALNGMLDVTGFCGRHTDVGERAGQHPVHAAAHHRRHYRQLHLGHARRRDQSGGLPDAGGGQDGQQPGLQRGLRPDLAGRPQLGQWRIHAGQCDGRLQRGCAAVQPGRLGHGLERHDVDEERSGHTDTVGAQYLYRSDDHQWRHPGDGDRQHLCDEFGGDARQQQRDPGLERVLAAGQQPVGRRRHLPRFGDADRQQQHDQHDLHRYDQWHGGVGQDRRGDPDAVRCEHLQRWHGAQYRHAGTRQCRRAG